jgi:hypothetical protein
MRCDLPLNRYSKRWSDPPTTFTLALSNSPTIARKGYSTALQEYAGPPNSTPEALELAVGPKESSADTFSLRDWVTYRYVDRQGREING